MISVLLCYMYVINFPAVYKIFCHFSINTNYLTDRHFVNYLI